MIDQRENFQDLPTKEKPNETRELKESLVSVAERIFIDSELNVTEALNENAQLALDISDEEVAAACSEAEQEIKAAASNHEGVLLKLFTNLAGKADKKWGEFKNRRNYKRVNNELSALRDKRNGEKLNNYREYKKNGNPEKFDDYFNKIYKEFPAIIDDYEKLDKQGLKYREVGSLEDCFESNLKALIYHKIEKGEIDESLDLWRHYDKKHSYSSFGGEMAEKIADKIIEDEGLVFSEDSQGDIERIHFIKERFKDYPDIYFLYLRKYGDRSYYRKTGFSENDEYSETLQKLTSDPSKDYVFSFVDIENDFLKNPASPEIVSACFNESLQHRSFYIKDHLNIFQNEVAKMDMGARYDLIKDTSSYEDDFVKYGSYFELSPKEIDLAIGFKEEEVGSISTDARLEREIKLKTFIDSVKKRSPLMLLANAKNLEIKHEEQEDLLYVLKQKGSMKEWAQLLAHPEKYPTLTAGEVDTVFDEYILQYNNKFDALSRIFTHDVRMDPFKKQELVKDFIAHSDPGTVLEFLYRNRAALNEEECNIFEEGFVSKPINMEYISMHSGEILKFSSENLEKLFTKIESIDWARFSSLFINYSQGAWPLEEGYFGIALSKLNNQNALCLYLDESLEKKEITPETYKRFLDKLYGLGYLPAVLKIDILKRNPEGHALLAERIIKEGEISDLMDVMELISRRNLILSLEQERDICLQAVKLLDSYNFSSFVYSYGEEVKRILGVKDNNQLINLFIEQGNGVVLGECLNLNISSPAEDKKIAEAIIDFGDSNSRLHLFDKLPWKMNDATEGESINKETLKELVAVMVEKGNPEELRMLLNGTPNAGGWRRDPLPEEQLSVVKERILESKDQAVIASLFYKYFSQAVALTETEREKMVGIITNNFSGNAEVSRDILRASKQLGLSQDQINTNLVKLGRESGSFFIDLLQSNMEENYFQTDPASLEEIFTGFIKHGSDDAFNLYSLHCKFPDNFPLSAEQFDLAIKTIEQRWNYGYILTRYISLERDYRQSLEGKSEALLSEDQKRNFIIKYLKDANGISTGATEVILEAYPEIFEQAFLDNIRVDYNSESLIRLLEYSPEALKPLITKHKEGLVIFLKDKKDYDKRSNLCRFYTALNKIGLFTKSDLNEIGLALEGQKDDTDRVLDWASVFAGITENKDINQLKEIVGEDLAVRLTEFRDKHAISGKGKTILTLLGANEYKKGIESQKDLSPDSVLKNISSSLESYEEVLSLYNPENIPKGLQVSIGMEYEATQTIANSYKEKSGHDYRSDAVEVSRIAGIGMGNDAEHEFATKPTDNPYLMLLEMQLLQELGYFDFNFKDEDEGGYKGAAVGYHLTIGGEKGLEVNENTNFLQNIIVASNLGGVCSSREVSKVGRGRGSIRQRGAGGGNNFKVFDNMTNSVELRSFSINKWEQFERAILASHNGALAIQAVEKYTEVKGIESLELLKKDFPADADSLYEMLREDSLLKDETPDQRTKEIIYEWIKMQVLTTEAFEDHNNNFLDNETSGYLDESGEWVDVKDFSRGRDNKKAFESIIAQTSPDTNIQDYFADNLKIDYRENIFKTIDTEMLNRLIRINNLYLKGDQVNIQNMLNTTIENGVPFYSDSKDVESSIFDKDGKNRKGNYYIQGSSERMLVNRIQKLILDFTENMQNILRSASTEIGKRAAA